MHAHCVKYLLTHRQTHVTKSQHVFVFVWKRLWRDIWNLHKRGWREMQKINERAVMKGQRIMERRLDYNHFHVLCCFLLNDGWIQTVFWLKTLTMVLKTATFLRKVQTKRHIFRSCLLPLLYLSILYLFWQCYYDHIQYIFISWSLY